jgi:amidase
MGNQHDFCYTPATKLAEKIRSKQVSPVEVMDAFIERIEQVNPKINAFCTLATDKAREEAIQAEKKIMRNEEVGPLHGLPVGIKDLTNTAGIRTTLGSKAFSDNVPQKDALLVKRIKQAGGIIIGKTNTPEFGHKGTTDNDLFGTSVNPWNVEMTPGGSSGGSAAAVAAGLVPFAEGSDGGGSIRIPASLCGIYGLKPTYGRIPFDGNGKDLFASQHPFLHNGPLTRTVEDAALFLSVMAGPDPCDPLCLPDTGENYTRLLQRDVKGLRIAYSPNLDSYVIDSRVQAAMDQAVEQLERLGCLVEEVTIDFGESRRTLIKAFSKLWFAHFAASYGHLIQEKREQFSPDVVKMIEIGQSMSAMDYRQVGQPRSLIYRKIEHVFQSYDFLITPTLAAPAFPHHLKGPSEINGEPVNPDVDWMLTGFFNLTGHPAASIPIGFTENGLPMGMQVVGKRFADQSVLNLSYAYEAACPWADRKPIL